MDIKAAFKKIAINLLCRYTGYLFLSGKGYDKAEDLFQKAIELEPNNAKFLDAHSRFLLDKQK